MDGEYLASQEVIFVSGWFASSDLEKEHPENSSGNYGLMDLVKGLEWVRDNIFPKQLMEKCWQRY